MTYSASIRKVADANRAAIVRMTYRLLTGPSVENGCIDAAHISWRQKIENELLDAGVIFALWTSGSRNVTVNYQINTTALELWYTAETLKASEATP